MHTKTATILLLASAGVPISCHPAAHHRLKYKHAARYHRGSILAHREGDITAEIIAEAVMNVRRSHKMAGNGANGHRLLVSHSPVNPVPVQSSARSNRPSRPLTWALVIVSILYMLSGLIMSAAASSGSGASTNSGVTVVPLNATTVGTLKSGQSFPSPPAPSITEALTSLATYSPSESLAFASGSALSAMSSMPPVVTKTVTPVSTSNATSAAPTSTDFSNSSLASSFFASTASTSMMSSIASLSTSESLSSNLLNMTSTIPSTQTTLSTTSTEVLNTTLTTTAQNVVVTTSESSSAPASSMGASDGSNDTIIVATVSGLPTVDHGSTATSFIVYTFSRTAPVGLGKAMPPSTTDAAMSLTGNNVSPSSSESSTPLSTAAFQTPVQASATSIATVSGGQTTEASVPMITIPVYNQSSTLVVTITTFLPGLGTEVLTANITLPNPIWKVIPASDTGTGDASGTTAAALSPSPSLAGSTSGAPMTSSMSAVSGTASSSILGSTSSAASSPPVPPSTQAVTTPASTLSTSLTPGEQSCGSLTLGNVIPPGCCAEPQISIFVTEERTINGSPSTTMYWDYVPASQGLSTLVPCSETTSINIATLSLTTVPSLVTVAPGQFDEVPATSFLPTSAPGSSYNRVRQAVVPQLLVPFTPSPPSVMVNPSASVLTATDLSTHTNTWSGHEYTSMTTIADGEVLTVISFSRYVTLETAAMTVLYVETVVLSTGSSSPMPATNSSSPVPSTSLTSVIPSTASSATVSTTTTSTPRTTPVPPTPLTPAEQSCAAAPKDGPPPPGCCVEPMYSQWYTPLNTATGTSGWWQFLDPALSVTKFVPCNETSYVDLATLSVTTPTPTPNSATISTSTTTPTSPAEMVVELVATSIAPGAVSTTFTAGSQPPLSASPVSNPNYGPMKVSHSPFAPVDSAGAGGDAVLPRRAATAVTQEDDAASPQITDEGLWHHIHNWTSNGEQAVKSPTALFREHIVGTVLAGLGAIGACFLGGLESLGRHFDGAEVW